jgi:glutamate 5-kinase
MTWQTPIHRVAALDESLFVDDSRVVDRNAIVDVALRVRENLAATDEAVVLVLDRCEAVGRTKQGPLNSVGRDQRALVYQAMGVVPVLHGLVRELEALGLNCGLVNASRESFADRRQYFGVRDVVRGMLRNGAVPIILDLGETLPSPGASRADYLQVAAMLVGMLGAGSLDIHLGGKEPIELVGPDGPVRHLLIDELDALWRSSEIKTTTRGGDLVEPLLAAARLVAHSGATIAVRGEGAVGARRTALLTISSPTDRRSMTGVQRWLVAGAVPEGSVVASEYAASKLTQDTRGSLLAAGVVRCEGSFDKDAVVSVLDEEGRLLGYGVSRYGSADLERVRGTPDVVVVHADHFFGVGLGALATASPSAG